MTVQILRFFQFHKCQTSMLLVTNSNLQLDASSEKEEEEWQERRFDKRLVLNTVYQSTTCTFIIIILIFFSGADSVFLNHLS